VTHFGVGGGFVDFELVFGDGEDFEEALGLAGDVGLKRVGAGLFPGSFCDVSSVGFADGFFREGTVGG
jgi:hypothetical protein